MRLTRKTMVALGMSGALTVMAGVTASAAVLGLPILGFGEAASRSAAPQVVHKTVYDDTYVTASTAPKAAPTASSGARAETTGGGGGAPAAAPAAPAAAPVYPAVSTPALTRAPEPESTEPTRSVEPPDEEAPEVTTSRPPIPAGCREPEWDSEHRVWQCSSSEVGG